MYNITVEDAVEIVLASDHKTTDFLTNFGVQAIKTIDKDSFALSSKVKITLTQKSPFEIPLGRIYIYNISGYELDTMAYSTKRDCTQEEDEMQKCKLISIELDGDYSVDYYIRESLRQGYFLESRIKNPHKNGTVYEIPIYNKIPDRYQSLLEQVRLDGKIY